METKQKKTTHTRIRVETLQVYKKMALKLERRGFRDFKSYVDSLIEKDVKENHKEVYEQEYK